jgi:hypothetical protein
MIETRIFLTNRASIIILRGRKEYSFGYLILIGLG